MKIKFGWVMDREQIAAWHILIDFRCKDLYVEPDGLTHASGLIIEPTKAQQAQLAIDMWLKVIGHASPFIQFTHKRRARRQ